MQTTDGGGAEGPPPFPGADIPASIRECISLWRMMYQPFFTTAPTDRARQASDACGKALAGDPVHLMLRVNSLMLESTMRYWLRWQEALSTHVPAITRSLERCRPGERPDAQAAQALADTLRNYFRDAIALPCDHCRRVQEDLRTIEQELFGETAQTSYRRRHKYKD